MAISKKGVNQAVSRYIPIVLMMGIAILMRLIPHPPNFTPVLAIGLFGAITIPNNSLKFAIPIVIMIVSDAFIGFHQTLPFVYLAIALGGSLGIILKNHFSYRNLILTSTISSVLFFIITNIGVWLTGLLYPKTAMGLYQCLIAAIPFFHNTLLSTIAYSIAIFSGYKLMIQQQTVFEISRK